MKYTGLRARIRALEAGLGTNVTKIVITGGLPDDYQPPAAPQPKPPHPPRMAAFPADSEPSD